MMSSYPSQAKTINSRAQVLKLTFQALAALLLMVISNQAFTNQAVNEINVTQGQTLNAPASSPLQLDRLIMEDNSTLIINSDLREWLLTAEYVEIGNNVRIIANGSHGTNANNITQPYPENTQCSDAQNGQDAQSGSSGYDGVNLELDLNIARFGSLTIESTGGNGGNGGDGGNGESLDQTKACEEHRKGDKVAGGRGGNAGDGGDGGSGGDIVVRYAFIDPSQANASIKNAITILNQGGKGGLGGTKGTGGNGSPGFYTKRKSLTGNQTWSKGGKKGKNGDSGRKGLKGKNGRVKIALIPGRQTNATVKLKPIENTHKHNQAKKDKLTEIEMLRKELADLKARVERLEKQQ